ncbi:hypothetical protein D3C73_1032630 [compost metagenome]
MFGSPDDKLIYAERLLGSAALAVHAQNLAVGKQRQRPVVVVPQLAAEDQRRAEDAPERHHRQLLVTREPGPAVRSPAIHRADADVAERQHIAVRPGPGLRNALPFPAAAEHIKQQRPLVPKVVRNPPHVGMSGEELRIFHRSGSGGEAQHHRPAAALNGFGDQDDLRLMGVVQPGSRDIIDLHQVDSPLCVQFKERIVIRLRPFF